MICYKLTDQNAQTKNATQWGENVTHTAPGTGHLCSAGWLHAYTDPLLAVLLNPMHANIQDPRLWEARGDGSHKDDRGLKIGFAKLTTIKELPLPVATTMQRVAFGILCALEVEKKEGWRKWAHAWLDGSDRSRAAAAAYAAYAASYAASYANAANAAAAAAYVAADAASYAAYAASYAADATAAYAASYAAYAASYPANAASYPANAAEKQLDLIAIARKAMEVKP